MDAREVLDLIAAEAEAREDLPVKNDREFLGELQGVVNETGFTAFDLTDQGVVIPDFTTLPPIETFYIISYWSKETGTPPNEEGESHLYMGTRPVPPHLQGKQLTRQQLVAETRRLMRGRHAPKILAVIPKVKAPEPGQLRGKPVKEPSKLADAAQVLMQLQAKYGQKGAAQLIGANARSLRGWNEFFKGAQGPRTRAPSEKVYARLMELRGLV